MLQHYFFLTLLPSQLSFQPNMTDIRVEREARTALCLVRMAEAATAYSVTQNTEGEHPHAGPQLEELATLFALVKETHAIHNSRRQELQTQLDALGPSTEVTAKEVTEFPLVSSVLQGHAETDFLHNYPTSVSAFETAVGAYKEAVEKSGTSVSGFRDRGRLPPRQDEVEESASNTARSILVGAAERLQHFMYAVKCSLQKLSEAKVVMDSREGVHLEAAVQRAQQRKQVEEVQLQQVQAESAAMIAWGKLCVQVCQFKAQRMPHGEPVTDAFHVMPINVDPFHTQLSDQLAKEQRDKEELLATLNNKEKEVARLVKEAEQNFDTTADLLSQIQLLKKQVAELNHKQQQVDQLQQPVPALPQLLQPEPQLQPQGEACEPLEGQSSEPEGQGGPTLWETLEGQSSEPEGEGDPSRETSEGLSSEI